METRSEKKPPYFNLYCSADVFIDCMLSVRSGSGRLYSAVFTGTPCIFLFPCFRSSLFYDQLYIDSGAFGALFSIDRKMEQSGDHNPDFGKYNRSRDSDLMRVKIPAFVRSRVCGGCIFDGISSYYMENGGDAIVIMDSGTC